MRRIAQVFGLFLLAAMLSACGANHASIYRNPVLEPGDSVLIDAKQRAILTAPGPKAAATISGGSAGAGGQGQAAALAHAREILVCAEPSPDALSAISSTFAASLGGILPSGEQIQAALASSLSETARQLGQRNATIQLLRDGLYRQCEAYMNGLIDKAYYEQIANKYANAMVTLLAIEQLAPTGAQSASSSATTPLSVNTTANITGTAPEAAPDEADAAAGATPEGEETPAEAPSGSAQGSATAAPPVVAVNLPQANSQIEPHVSLAVNTMVTWFLTKDTVDYCLRGLFSGSTGREQIARIDPASNDQAFRTAFIEVCKEIILEQMAQQDRIASAFETAGGGTFEFDNCSAALRKFWKPDGTNTNTENAQRIQDEMNSQGVEGSITFLLRTRERAEDRRKVGAALGLSGCS